MGAKQERANPQKKQKTPIISIVGVGNTIVGKTELIKYYGQLQNQTMGNHLILDNDSSLIMVENTVKGEKNKDIKIKTKILDTPGHSRFETIVFMTIKNSEGIFLVYDITLRDTFDDLNRWIDKIKDWKDISNFPIIIIGNKLDLKAKRKVSTEEAQKFADKYRIPYFEVSAFKGEGVKEAFSALIQKAYETKYKK